MSTLKGEQKNRKQVKWEGLGGERTDTTDYRANDQGSVHRRSHGFLGGLAVRVGGVEVAVVVVVVVDAVGRVGNAAAISRVGDAAGTGNTASPTTATSGNTPGGTGSDVEDGQDHGRGCTEGNCPAAVVAVGVDQGGTFWLVQVGAGDGRG